MDRRTAIRTLATASVLPMVAPESATALLRARRAIAPGASADFAPAALSPRELDIVGIVADVILPRTETPSATDLEVPAFIDLLASEWMDAEQAEELHAGLAALDGDASRRFGRGVVEATAEERATLVRELDERLPAPGSAHEAPEGFYPTLKRLVLVGYFTTAEGASQTGYRISPGTFEGCVVSEAGQ